MDFAPTSCINVTETCFLSAKQELLEVHIDVLPSLLLPTNYTINTTYYVPQGRRLFSFRATDPPGETKKMAFRPNVGDIARGSPAITAVCDDRLK